MLFDCCSLHAGQACILHSRLLLPDSLHDDVVDRLVELARAVRVGDPTDPDVQMGPLISAAQRERVQAHVDGAVNDGAKLVTGGGRPAGLDVGFYFEPTILTDVDPDSTIAQEEVFGPVLTRAPLPRRRRRGSDREQLSVRTFRCGVGRRRGPRRRRCPPHPHRPDRGQRLRSR